MPVLLPVLPVLEPLPEVPGVPSPELPGVVVLDVPGELVLPALAPDGLVMPSSFRHFSRSAPSNPRHFALVAPVLVPLELVLPEPVPEAPAPVLGEFALGRLLLEELLALPVLPGEEPELCASVAPDSAKSAAAVAALMSFKVIRCSLLYLLLLPEELPELMPEPLEPEPELEPPMPLLGDLGAVVLLLLPLPDAPLPEVLPLEPLVLPPEAAPEPDLPKCASHSAREICPSLFLSTDEKLGVELDAPLDALGEEEELDDAPDALGDEEDGDEDELLGEDEELDAPPEALPEDLLSVALGLELLEPDAPVAPEAPELCADATPARAKSAADVAVTTTFNNI